MEKLRVQNYKSIVDSGEIEIKPLTVLVGKNSAGKSSFIRLFPLMKQTLEKKVEKSLLWYGDYVDFGNFKTTISNSSSNNDFIVIKLQFEVLPMFYRLVGTMDINTFTTVMSLKINEDSIFEYQIELYDQKIVLKTDEENNVSLFINESEAISPGQYVAQRIGGDIIPTFVSKEKQNAFLYSYDDFFFKMREKIYTFLPKRSRNNINHNLEKGKVGLSREGILNLLKESNPDKYSGLEFKSEKFVEINNLIITAFLPDIFESINRSFRNEFINISYIKPIRAAVNRYYRVQGISVEDVDSDGSNLPMLLRNMSTKELHDFEKWSKEKFGVVFSIDTRVDGHLSIIIRDDVKSKEGTNVADAGYGYSQMLPIVVLLWHIHNKKRTLFESKNIIIEQPELHLHPEFQAKLLDVFVNIINECKMKDIPIKIIIETHSETMINRIGTLICDGKCDKDDVSILVFNKKEGVTSIIKSGFDSEGMLENWPVDFLGIGE